MKKLIKLIEEMPDSTWTLLFWLGLVIAMILFALGVSNLPEHH